MKIYYKILFVINLILLQQVIALHSDSALYISEFTSKYGYAFESHLVTTEDGYILGLHRIPYSYKSNYTDSKPAVLLMHGLGADSTCWTKIGQNKSLALMFVDAGFDVWLGNVRGTLSSSKHLTLNPRTQAAEFYNFSWHEIGVYDLPASIDFILRKTNQKDLFYVGHSQGTTAFFVMTSMRPQYNQKIRLMHALAPVAFMSNLRSPLVHSLANYWKFVKLIISDLLNIHALPNYFLLLISGPMEQSIHTRLPVIFGSVTPQISLKQAYHYLQEVKSGDFSQYDFGWIRNLHKYGSIMPLKYNLSGITAPVMLYYAKNDELVAIEDVVKLLNLLPNVESADLLEPPSFGHADFLWAKDVDVLLYNNIIERSKAKV